MSADDDTYQTQHVAALLPAYLNGTLEARASEHVRRHLAQCEACRQERASWETFRDIAQYATSSVQAPSPQVFAHILAKIDAAPVLVASAEEHAQPSAMRNFAAFWRLLPRQPRLMHRAIWVASTVAMIFAALYAAAVWTVHGPSILAIFLPVIAAGGMAFLYGPEADPALEVVLATPISPRLTLLCRVIVLLGYDVALALGATTLLAVLHGEPPGALVTTWLGPLALLSAGSLLTSLVLGPATAAAGSLAIWLAQFFQLDATYAVRLTSAPFWQTNPLTLALAAFLLFLALLYTPNPGRSVRMTDG